MGSCGIGRGFDSAGGVEAVADDVGVGRMRRQRFKGVVEGRRAPAEMSRKGQARSLVGRWGRMKVWRLRGVVVIGESTVRGRSGIGGEKRMMRKRGDVIIVVGGRWRAEEEKGGCRREESCMMEVRVFLENRFTHHQIFPKVDFNIIIIISINI